MNTTFINDKNFIVLCTKPFTNFAEFYTELAILREKDKSPSKLLDTYLNKCIDKCEKDFGIDLYSFLPHPNFWKKAKKNNKLEGSKKTWVYKTKSIWGDTYTVYLGKFINKRNRDHVTFIPYIIDNSLSENVEIAMPDFSFTNKTDAWKYALIHLTFYLENQYIIDSSDSDKIIICPKDTLGKDEDKLVQIKENPTTLVRLNDDFMRIWQEGIPSIPKQ